MGKFFEHFFTPFVYVQNDQSVMEIILRYACWATHRHPPPPPTAPWWLTAQPAYPLGLGQRRGRGGGSGTPETVEHPSGSGPSQQPPP